MITKEQFDNYGITVSNELIGNAALEWISENTTLEVDLNDVTTLEALPFSAKLFISKFDEIVSASSVVVSESIEGMSLSFHSTDKSTLLWQTAEQLLGNYLKSRVRFVTAKKRWKEI